MPTYDYEALNDSGKQTRGEVTAVSSEEAVAQIRSQGYFPTSVRPQKVKKSRGAKAAAVKSSGEQKKWHEVTITIGGVSQKVLTSFTRQMSTLQDAGLPILRSVGILEEQQKPGMLKNVLKDVYEDVSGGSTLSDAMAKHPKVFDKLYTKMIAAGEVGGVLDLILQRLADFLEKAAKLRRKIIGAMIYPAVVLSVAGAIVTMIMLFIVPKFEKIFDDFDTELPGMTKMLMNGSRWLAGKLYPGQVVPGVVYVLLSPFVIFFGVKLIRKSKMGKAVLDRLALKIPVAGMLISKSTIARFTRTLGTLISAGVPILDAIQITKETTANEVYVTALAGVHDSVRQGDTFSEPLRRTKVCDAIVVNMIDVGEETGELDKMLMKIADNYDDEVDTLVAALVSLLEPIMVVLLGGIVGFIVIALFMPLVALIQSVS